MNPRTVLPVLAAAALLTVGGAPGASAQYAPSPAGAVSAQDVATAQKPGHWTSEDGGKRLRFTGTVAIGAAASFDGMVTPSTTEVVVTVPGGDLGEGLLIAQRIRDRRLALVIDGPCAGPCADYWFPAAAARSTDAPGSWLGYVRDFSQTPNADNRLRSKEAWLYTAVGVDTATLHAYVSAELDQRPKPLADIWMPSKADLSRLGYPDGALRQVVLPADYAAADALARTWGIVAVFQFSTVGAPLPAPSGPARIRR